LRTRHRAHRVGGRWPLPDQAGARACSSRDQAGKPVRAPPLRQALRPRRRRRAPGHWQLSPGLPVYDSELARPGNIRPHPRAAGAYRAVDVDAP
jgi:hypothetical protein